MPIGRDRLSKRAWTDARVKFQSRGPGYTLFLSPTKTVVSLRGEESAPTSQGSNPLKSKAAVLRIGFAGMGLDHVSAFCDEKPEEPL